MNLNHISGCPTIKDLMAFDNSNQNISGKFIENNGTWTRTKAQVTNHYMFYDKAKLPVVCVDCSANFFNPALEQQLIIEPHDFVWADKTDVTNSHTFTKFHGRYVAGCQTATLAYDWYLMTDTIYYMRTGCTQTNYDGTITYQMPETAFSFDNPYSTLHYKDQVSNLKSQPVKNCIDGCNQTDPYKKPGY